MKIYLRLLKYLLPYKKTVLITWGLSLLVLALQGVSVWVGAGFIEKLLVGAPPGMPASEVGLIASCMNRVAVAILQQSTPFLSLLAGVCALVGAAFLTALLRVFKTYLFARVNQDILTKIRAEMFLHITRLDLSFSRKYKHGALASLFIQDVDQLQSGIIDAVDRGFMQPLRLVMAIVLMMSLSVELTLWTMFFLLASSLIVHLAGDRIERLSRDLMEKVENLQGRLTEYLSTVILARSLGREKKDSQSFMDACRTLANSAIEFKVVRAFAPQMISILFMMSGALLLIIGGHKVLVSHTMAGSDLIKMTLLLPVATYPIEAMATLYISIRITLASARRVFGIFDQEITFQDQPGAIDPKPLRHGIELKNVSCIIDGNCIIDKLSFFIPKGGVVVIKGPSGAGKTTILGLIAGFVRLSDGSILIDGVNIQRINGEKWRRRIGIVTQEPILINGTIRDNLLYAQPDAEDERLRQVLKESLLWTDKCAFIQGLDTQVGNRGELISGGERQRLTIARALLKNPDVLLLDEPTAMLDEANKEKIKLILSSLAGSRTLVIATHDPSLMDIADIEVTIEAGIFKTINVSKQHNRDNEKKLVSISPEAERFFQKNTRSKVDMD